MYILTCVLGTALIVAVVRCCRANNRPFATEEEQKEWQGDTERRKADMYAKLQTLVNQIPERGVLAQRHVRTTVKRALSRPPLLTSSSEDESS